MKTTIQTMRKHARKGCTVDQGFDTDARGNKQPVFYASPGAFAGEKFAHEVRTLGRDGHTGWYTNNHGESSRDGYGLCRGVVLEFDPRPGFPEGWFIAGYNMNGGMCTYFPHVYATADDAASAADQHAEAIAETEREYQEKWEAARNLSEAIDDASKRLRECLALRHRACMAYVRNEARELVASIREKREALAASEFAGEF